MSSETSSSIRVHQRSSAFAFIETQFPVSKLSKESYKERKAGNTQTLTSLGKWWGRKPLILVRATIIGLLIPASNNPKRDREIFLKILTMDEDGLDQRKTKLIAPKDVYGLLNTSERKDWFEPTASEALPKLKQGKTTEERQLLQKIAFNRLSYDDKLTYCDRPEHINGLSEQAWDEINAHLKTQARNLSELVQQLGEKQFGHTPRVGDAFCGGGSVPFEAARIGCEAYGSDLNPVASLLTWAALNIVGGGEEIAKQVRQAQQQVYNAVDRQIAEWGIEHNEEGWRADAYLYCNEARCPECKWMVPLARSWVIGQRRLCVAKLNPDPGNKRFDILIESDVSTLEMSAAQAAGTVKDSVITCPYCHQSSPISIIRGREGLRLWENDDLIPRQDDVLQERLYCIRWVRTYLDEKGKERTERYYSAPTQQDFDREAKVLKLLEERFHDWQEKGYIPSRQIEPGYNTDQPIRERGWTHWHHLFNPRQLLVLGLLENELHNLKQVSIQGAAILSLFKCCDYMSRLSRWDSSSSKEMLVNAFSNQALNTLFNYGTRGFTAFDTSWFLNLQGIQINPKSEVIACDARAMQSSVDIWVTDPPYADAVNYHELSEFFLDWCKSAVEKHFPDWYTDSKRALAITGKDENFRKSMADCYCNLANHMPADGYQVVMFTHQDAGVWADLALILWASGLRVTAAWCIATETSSALKEGNYVQGTVLLVLRKQTSKNTAFLDEVYPKVELEVKHQLDSMLALEDEEDPNFGDTDYQLAAYAAALRVLTQYQNIEDIDIAYELSKPRKKGSDKSEIEKIIDQAVVIACDYLVPKGFDTFVWKSLTPEERFYLKGLDIESHGEYRTGAYQELARGFGVKDYKPFLQSGKANQTCLKTATEFTTKTLGDIGFSASLVRNALFAIRETVRTESTQQGKSWLRAELRDYWNQRKNLIEILRYLSTMGCKINHWATDAKAAEILAGALENDSV